MSTHQILVNKILALEVDDNAGTMVSRDAVLAAIKGAYLPEADQSQIAQPLAELKVSDRVAYGTLQAAYQILRTGAVHTALMIAIEELREANPEADLRSVEDAWKTHQEEYDPENFELLAPDYPAARDLMQGAFQYLLHDAQHMADESVNLAVGENNERVAAMQREVGR